MKTKHNYKLKPLFLERMQKLLLDEKDFNEYLNILKIPPVKSFRCNTLKISPSKLKKKLEAKAWKISQPWKKYPEVMIVENELLPGELGRALEHLLGYYYIQELASMLPVLALKPSVYNSDYLKKNNNGFCGREQKPNEIILDLCSAPGSKTTQIASEMKATESKIPHVSFDKLRKNTGTIIANEVSLGRIKILASNLERCGVANAIISRKDGVALCNRIKKYNPELKFDRILVDAPCSGEGTLRSSPKTYLMWNIKTINKLSRLQKNLVASAFEILKPNGKLVYSTCTHAPEENEEVVDYILKELGDKIKLEKISLPIKTREGLTNWNEKEFSPEVKKCARIYPQDNNTEGFFIARFRKLK